MARTQLTRRLAALKEAVDSEVRRRERLPDVASVPDPPSAPKPKGKGGKN